MYNYYKKKRHQKRRRSVLAREGGCTGLGGMGNLAPQNHLIKMS